MNKITIVFLGRRKGKTAAAIKAIEILKQKGVNVVVVKPPKNE